MRCAKCGRWIFRHSPVNANYCPQDGVFLCRRCVARQDNARVCPACSTPIRSDHPKFFVASIVIVIFVGIFFSVFAFGYFHDSAVQGTPYATTATAQPGTTVHIAGTIHGPAGAKVIWGHYVRCGSKCSHWTYGGTSFTLVAQNASLTVDASHIQQVYTAPWTTNGGDDLAFYVGDHAELIGPVNSVLGQPMMQAQYAALGPHDFLSAQEGEIALVAGGILTAMVATASALEIVALVRSRRHRENTTGPNAFQYRIQAASSPPSP